MPLTKEVKQELVLKYGQRADNTGSIEAQIAMLTERINQLTKHFHTNPKDFHSRRGLLKMVGRRRRLLDYLKSNDITLYRSLIQDLGIRR
ncbi:MAG TPA: 30S ribosomal protein S15 [bacterium]|nr:30S ribosomal protein S15 [bacterium]HPR88362.1 30S ribosomal protein S15 [bacterium]